MKQMNASMILLVKNKNLKPTQGDVRKNIARRARTRKSGMFTQLNKSSTSGDQAMYTDDLVNPI